MFKEATALADIPIASNAAFPNIKLEKLDIKNDLKSVLNANAIAFVRHCTLRVGATHIELALKLGLTNEAIPLFLSDRMRFRLIN